MTNFLTHVQAALAGGYAVERELGSGGMATVYLAQDVKHRRPVAIKVLAPELAAALGRERFLREIDTARALLAAAYRATGRSEDAELELRAAASTFRGLGADLGTASALSGQALS